MSEPIATGEVIWASLVAICGVAWGGVRWLLHRHVKQIDTFEARIVALEKDKVGEGKIDAIIARFEKAIGEVHTRLDDIYKILITKGH